MTDNNYDFQWDEKQLKNSNYGEAVTNMYNSLDIIIKYAQTKNVKIAFETEGSLKKKKSLINATSRGV